jgi:protein involved in polysaccharide export with SLBB domain
MMKQFLFYVFLLLSTTQIYGQAKKVDPSVIRNEITRRGFTESEVSDKLKEKGIFLNIDNVSANQLQEVRKQIEEAMLELEGEKNLKKPKNVDNTETEAVIDDKVKTAVDKVKATDDKKVVRKDAKDVATEIVKDVKAGASLEEALGDKLAQANRDSIPVTVWGQHAFRQKQIPIYVAEKTYQTPESYILGTDDKITISIASARVYYNQSFVVNKQGSINPDKMPRINLKGVTYAKAKQIIASAYRPYYNFSPEHLELIVSGTRTTSVNVVGEVVSPGTFTISALNTAFNALVFAQGPSNIGSLRNIDLIRSNGQRKRVDIYEYLTNPSIANKDFFLNDNDYVSVPVAEKIITVKGAIVRPMKYELLKGENLNKLVFYAGGLAENAYVTTLQVKRFVNDKEKIIDIPYNDLKTSGRDFDLLNGDVVNIKSIPKKFENFVTVTGAVDLQGDYEISSGMRISELLRKSILKRDARLDVAYLKRLNKDLTAKTELIRLQDILNKPYGEQDIALQDNDQLYIFSLDRYARKDSVKIIGAVRTPNLKYPYDPSKSLKINDLVLLAGGLKPDATPFAYIVRTDTSNSKVIQYIRINDLNIAIQNPAAIENLTLMPNDELRIFSKLTYTDAANVKVSGAVRTPGEYHYDETLTLKDVLIMSGGLRMEADLGKLEVYRVDLQKDIKTTVAVVTIDRDLKVNGDANFQLHPYDQIVVRTVPKFHLQQYVTLNGEVKYPGEYALTKENETVGELLLRAGNYTPEAFPEGATLFRAKDSIGYIILTPKPTANGKASTFDLPIREGDVIEIPKSKDFVTIIGATKAGEMYQDKILTSGKINVAYVGAKSAYYYVETFAAGVHKDGRARLITVRHPNGRLQKTKNYGFFKVYPNVQRGSIINVGYKEVKVKDEKKGEAVDWNKTFADILSKTTAVLSMILLFKSINK